MNTGADDDSLSTPTFAFSKSSARATPVATNASRHVDTSRANPIIQLPPPLFKSHPSALKHWHHAAAEPAASPIAKQAPETRAADWPSWVIEAQRPATSRLSMPSGVSMRYGSSLKPRDSGIGGNLKITSPATCCSIGQPLTPIES